MVNANISKVDALFNLGRYDDAIGIYDEILEFYPDEIRALIGKGDALLKLGKYDEAIATYDTVRSLPVDDIGAVVHAGESKALAIEALEEEKKKQISGEVVNNITTTITKNNTIR